MDYTSSKLTVQNNIARDSLLHNNDLLKYNQVVIVSAKELACQSRKCETQVRSLDREDLLEDGMATHSSILAWRLPWTEEPGGLQSTGRQSQTRLKRLSKHASSKIKPAQRNFTM